MVGGSLGGAIKNKRGTKVKWIANPFRLQSVAVNFDLYYAIH
jgi:hypothetical protein